MISSASRVLAAVITVATSATTVGTVLADGCSTTGEGVTAADCSARQPVRSEVRSPATRNLAQMRWPEALSDEPISAELFEMPLALELETSDLIDASRAAASQRAPSASMSRVTPSKFAADSTGLGTWSKVEKLSTRDDDRTRSGLGLDYKPSRSASIGMAVESEENLALTSLTEQSKLGATFGLKPSPLLSFEAKAAWARQGSGDLASHVTHSAHSERSARIDGDMRLGGFKLAPSVSVTQTTELGAADTAKAPKGTLIVAPSISRPFNLAPSRALEPFLTYKEKLDIGAPALHAGSQAKADSVRSAGGGVKLENRGTYSLSVMSAVENLDAERYSMKSQLRLNLQLK